MAHLHNSAASLRISGDDFDPDAISTLLCCQPTTSYRKGEAIRSSTGLEFIKKTGAWMLNAEDETPADLDAQVRNILDKLPSDPDTWQTLSARFEIDLFCGWFMKETNEGLEVPADTLRRLGERSILLAVCIYAPLSKDYNGANT
jgi:Domain of unknown function (DUF4279)